MLSFMQEQELPNLSGEKPPAPDTAAPDGAKKPPAQEYLTVASKSKRARKTTCLLVALFIIGGVGLLLMIKKSTPEKANAAGNTAETQIENAIARLTGIKSEMFSRMDRIVNKFYEFSDVQQIHVNQLVKNPFEQDAFTGQVEIPDGDLNGDVDHLNKQLRQRAKSLELLGVMQSGRGKYCCMIDDKILYEGDSIKGFQVKQIGNNFVRLEMNQPQTGNVEIVLKLSE
ncbi:MAG: hypothetical protein ACYTEQ_11205 [Planctomycetota bacterium]|jgi:hypothetical protein